MGIREVVRRVFTPEQKSAAVPLRLGYGGAAFAELMENRNDEEILRAYSNDPWLYAAVSRIAQSVAMVKWHLFEVGKDGEKSEVTDQNDELLRLLNHPNSMQTGGDLMEFGEVYSLLTGKDYWRLTKEKGKWELNIIPSVWVKPILDKSNVEIVGYHYERSGFIKDFPAEEILPFVHPNPISPLEAVGPAHPIQIDLSIHNYARLFNRYFFYNNAESGVILKTESADQTEIDRIKEKYKAEHRGYGRAFNIDIFSGVTEILQSESKHKDMHFNELMEYERKLMLGSFGMPYTILGGTDLVQRGNAEAAQYTYAKWVLHPRLEFRKRKLNEYLVPRFGDNRILDYDDPTPEDRASLVLEAMQGWNGGLFTRNEALKILKYDPLTGPEGDEYKQTAPNPFESFGQPSGGGNGAKSYQVISDPKAKTLFLNEEATEIHWRAWVKQAESFEPRFIDAMQSVFEATKKEALGNLTDIGREQKLIDLSKFTANYAEALTPVMTEVMSSAIKNGRELVEPKNPHKAVIPILLNVFALAWLRNRIEWAALQVGNETESLLRQVLIDGFTAGKGTDDIARMIQAIPGFADSTRAQRIARTEIISAHSQGTLEGYKESGRVRQVQFYTAMDERTCDYCLNYHNQIFNLGDQIPIPLHPLCRCVWLPIVEI